MENIVAIQRWLYSGMASGLADVAGGNTYAIVAAITAAILFGAVHALMPGHGKTVLVSYHLGQSAKLREGVANGAILALTHVGLALVLGFARHQSGIRLWWPHAAIRGRKWCADCGHRRLPPLARGE